jgi:hypothetical protein
MSKVIWYLVFADRKIEFTTLEDAMAYGNGKHPREYWYVDHRVDDGVQPEDCTCKGFHTKC